MAGQQHWPPSNGSGHKSAGYLSEDTITALLTPVGGAVSIVRVSGPAAISTMQSLVGSSGCGEPEPGRLKRALLKGSDGRGIDDCLVVCFRGPKSYTGEDCVEYHLHGSPYVASRLLESLADLGVRQALPGEFSFRAVRNGKMTVSQAQAVADLIGASNDAALALSLENISGLQSSLLSGIAEALRNLMMQAEIEIDFSDQGAGERDLSDLQKDLDPIIEKLQRLRESYDRGRSVQDGVGAAFVGLPNAGKSSLFNALLGEDRSIVSEVAGTTRNVVRERITLRGRFGTVTVRLEDTAGLRSSGDAIERMGIDRTMRAAGAAELVILLVDASQACERNSDLLAGEWARLGVSPQKTIGILTKCDLVALEGRRNLAVECRNWSGIQTWLETSAKTGEGISKSAEEIASFCEKWTHREKGEVLLTRLEQARAVGNALDHLRRARLAPQVDLFAADVRQALHSLGVLIGDTLPEDLLNEIFSKFCIGK